MSRRMQTWKLKIAAILLGTALSGCAANGDSQREALHSALVDVTKVDVPSGRSASNAKADAAFRQTIAKCAKVLNALETRGDARRKRAITIAVIGSLAGAVFAPTVIADEGSKALAAGLSGLSGSLNSTQQFIGEQGYSRAELILARENIVSRLNQYVEQWLALEGINATDSTPQGRAKINAKIGIVNGMIVARSMYPLGPSQPSEEVLELVESAKSEKVD